MSIISHRLPVLFNILRLQAFLVKFGVSITLLLSLIGESCGAEKLLDYGFENWTGNRYTTPGYPFSSSQSAYCQRHDDATEVVRTYVVSSTQTWLPHSGNYFLLRNDASVEGGVPESGTTSSFIDNEMRRPNNFWNGHPIVVTKGAFTEERYVLSWSSTTHTMVLSSPLSFEIDNTCAYVVGFRLDPSVEGIPYGTVDDVGNIGLNGAACSQNNFAIRNDIRTGEIFIRFWARHNPGFYGRFRTGAGNIQPPYPGTKWIRVGCAGFDDDVFIHLSMVQGDASPDMLIYFDGVIHTRGEIPHAYDGNWHKYAMYINFNTGHVMGWFDIEHETRQNTTVAWTHPTGRLATCTGPESFVIQGNFCATWPLQITFHALDDIEVWDGLPSDGSPPRPPTNLKLK